MKKATKGPAVMTGGPKLWPVAKLVPNPRNPNRHPESQIAALAKIIAHQGWRSPIVVSKRSGFIVSGHGRYEAAKLLGVKEVPVDVQEFATEADEWAHLIADNRLAELAEMDNDLLGGILRDLDGQLDIELTGFDASTLDNIELQGAQKDPPLPDPDVEGDDDRAGRFLLVYGTEEEKRYWLSMLGVQDNGVVVYTPQTHEKAKHEQDPE